MQLETNSELQGGKYRIIQVLGQGGFGITYLAVNTLLDREVAIKEFFPKDFCGRDNTSHLTLGTQSNAEKVGKLKDRFLKEAKHIAKLDHPGIIRIHDVFEENNTAYYVMDYIEGENLNVRVKRDGPLHEAIAIQYICEVGDALAYIHSRNMTHFDVKPANIMIRDSDGQPILIDFGLSKQYDLNGDATSTLMQAVSKGFSPIELYYGSVTNFSPQTDVYSLGATLFFLLTGKNPPSADVLLEEGLEISEEISPEIRQVIKAAMTISRKNRPQSVVEVLEAIPQVEDHSEEDVPEPGITEGENPSDQDTKILPENPPVSKNIENDSNICEEQIAAYKRKLNESENTIADLRDTISKLNQEIYELNSSKDENHGMSILGWIFAFFFLYYCPFVFP